MPASWEGTKAKPTTKENNVENYFVPLCNDIAFKRLFKDEQNHSLLIALLNDFLPLPKNHKIVQAHVFDPELVPEDASHKRGVLDIKAEVVSDWSSGTNSEIVDVEMQTTSHPFLPERLTFYACKLYGGQLLAGQDFDLLKNVYSLTFTTFNVPGLRAFTDYYHAFDIREKRPPHTPFTPALNFVVVELSKFRHSLEQLLDSQSDWCYLLKNSGTMTEKEAHTLSLRGEIMSKAVKSLWNLSRSEILREIEEAEEKRRRDWRAHLKYRDQELNREIEEKGRTEGEKKKAVEIALKLLEAGTDPKFISKTTGLSLGEVKKLK